MGKPDLRIVGDEEVHEPFVLHFGVDGAGPFGEERSPFEVDFPAGVNVLCAPNNWGKSWLLRLLARFNMDKLAVGDLTVNDRLTGAMAKAWVNGATMRARAGRPPEVAGAPPQIEALPEPILQLRHGGHMKGIKPAFRERMGALLRWISMVSTEEILRELLGKDRKIEALYGRIIASNGSLKRKATGKDITLAGGVDLITATGRIRQAIHAMRRSVQEDLEIVKSAIDMIGGRKKEVVDSVDIDEAELSQIRPDVEAARDRLSAARSAHVALGTERERGLQEQERRTRALGDMGSRPDYEEKEAHAASLESVAAEADRVASSNAKEVERLRAELAQAETQAAEANAIAKEKAEALSVARDAVVEAKDAADRWDRLHEELTAEVDVPQEAAVQRASEAVATLELRLAHQEAAVRYVSIAGELDAKHEEADELAERIEFLRTEADKVWTRLASAVNEKLKGEDIRVGEDETVEIRVDGGWFDITDKDRVGEGVVFNACYQLLLKYRRGQRVIVIEGHTTIDPQHLEELATQARAQDTVLILERAPVKGEEMPPSEFKLDYYPAAQAA